MKNVALIMAHENAAQIERLMRLLMSGGWSAIVHVDSIMPKAEYQELRATFSGSPVVFLKRRHIPWGSDAMINIELELLQEAIKENADYCHLLSGADLPIRPLTEINSFFMKHNGYEFVQVIPDWGMKPEIRERVSLYHYLQRSIGRNKGILFQLKRIINHLQRVVGVNRLKNNEINGLYGGMNWFSISREFAGYVLGHSRWVRKTFAHSLCGDELFLQTLLMNSIFANRRYIPVQNTDQTGSLRLVDWKRGKPYTWSAPDYEEIIASDNLFARKFRQDTQEGAAVVERITAHVIRVSN